MSGLRDLPIQLDELMDILKDYIDSFNALYQLKTNNAEERKSIYNMFKTNLLKTKKYLPQTIIAIISRLYTYNNRCIKSYLQLVKQIYDDFHPKIIKNVNVCFEYLFYKEYGILLEECGTEHFKKHQDIDTNVHEENTTGKAIMDDDKNLFISFTEREGFDHKQKIANDLYPVDKLSLLELCCYHGSVNCFKFLRTKFNSEITKLCLEFSFLSGNPEIMSECLKYQKPNKDCMKYAIISHNIDFVTFLMNEYNIKINLEYCTEFSNPHAFLVYLDQTHDFNMCLVYSPRFFDVKLCEYLISHGAKIYSENDDKKNALHIAAECNSKETAEILISHGANIGAECSCYRKTPLHIAAECNSKETAELLVLHCKNIDEKNINEKTALHYAAYQNSKEIAEFLILHGANVMAKNYREYTPLHETTTHNCKEIAEFLISHGADINAKDKDGRTTLHLAAYSNRKELAEMLISHGADINAKDKKGKTPLHEAANNKSTETAELLISHGADINEKDEDGNTALHFAAMSHSKEIAEFLFSHGADTNARDEFGETPLHNAAFHKDEEIMKLLISHGADITARSKSGNSPLYYSTWNQGHSELGKQLIAPGENHDNESISDDNETSIFTRCQI
ncbi:hypothetical protein TVAG_473970 [Trichomonas vaginalis G3]|uniref:DUF3447 domain-containing protein n=1 Tax=Trichomonas vaginalis (strain ATCC PRA-98 / G3) TaxID=412133 RepID=A2EQ43_TRIV3|nr:ankyrin repeat and SOCS box-containing protein 4 family [Trichomonas vaginalis G3]EAY05218.1 hypothetical protein TVAG_473970 [Trichomonas vaginalis G3]KAI5542615.1 ankyrin repeat and SOCS box-containing protein 4 family [Trichomonas vaginalis G3]|eukprot:XP_001317441.1 hypothetical protein [Trichomonas vaginalis G3]